MARAVLVIEMKKTLPDLPPAPTFDFGANITRSNRELRSAFLKFRIFSFGPMTATFNRLKQGVKAHHVECHHLALGRTSAEIRVTSAGVETGNFIVADSAAGHPTEITQMMTGGGFSAKYDIEHIAS